MKSIVILMSTYNGETYIRDQILSIVNQQGNFSSLLIVRDDGSKDNTCSIVSELSQSFPEKIKLLIGDNIGCNAAFFELLRIAPDADYYAFSDQDDVWLENKLESAVSFLACENESTPLLYASTSYLVFDDLKPFGKTREMKKNITFYNSIIQNICPGHNQVINRKMRSLLCEPLIYGRIYFYDSWIANVANLFGKILFDNNAHTFYRQHSNQQLGYGKGIFGRLKVSGKHAFKGDGRLYRNQVKYFCELYQKQMHEKGFYKEILRFLSPRNFFSRLAYLMSSKLYRQSRLETLAFKLLYLFGDF